MRQRQKKKNQNRSGYTAGDVVRYLAYFGFKYTTHGLRKQVLAGCIPGHKKLSRVHRRFDIADRMYFEVTAVLRSLDVPLRTIALLNNLERPSTEKEKLPPDARKGVSEIIKIINNRIDRRKEELRFIAEYLRGRKNLI